MGLGKISFLDLEFDFDEMATTLSSMNFTGPVEYDPETAQLPDLMMRLCAFGMAMLLGVSVTMLLSSADLRQSPPKYALTFAVLRIDVAPQQLQVRALTFPRLGDVAGTISLYLDDRASLDSDAETCTCSSGESAV
eukprot:CAMPEP_0117504808 /NCGR_PEP_ID=MMETSP0784-20121206/25042_1 /TAXON_ID=39447 /ORGANISM="" /LENGTH=135 /DNA_ID=CAMNT_0005300179 /DNA_START=111 /DNA_END=517 /DNA_ORIENTATION=+